MTVATTFANDRWVTEIRWTPSIPAIVEYLDISDILQVIYLNKDADRFTWKLTMAGKYSAKSAYLAFFMGRTRKLAAKELWSAGPRSFINYLCGLLFETDCGRRIAWQGGG
jgi:hypothetical protein